MNADLEETLQELGPGCRAVVERLRAGQTAEEQKVTRVTRVARGMRGWLAPASLALIVGFGAALGLLRPRADSCLSRLSCPSCPSCHLPPRDYTLSVDEMIATQNPDGSWQSDFLTRHHAKALAGCPRADARIAYKKAMRNLRVRGVL